MVVRLYYPFAYPFSISMYDSVIIDFIVFSSISRDAHIQRQTKIPLLQYILPVVPEPQRSEDQSCRHIGKPCIVSTSFHEKPTSALSDVLGLRVISRVSLLRFSTVNEYIKQQLWSRSVDSTVKPLIPHR